MLESKSDAHVAFVAATTGDQQRDMPEAAPSSRAQVAEPAGWSSIAPADGAGQYPQEAEHEAQIADLQASPAISFFYWLCCLQLACSHPYHVELFMFDEWSSERHVHLSRS